jgi:serine/threonine protein kinase
MSDLNRIKALIEATGKYEVLSAFTEGANGYAFKARHKHLECYMFLKVIDANPETDKTFAEPQALMNALASGGCENLVRLHDTEHLGGDYILMSMEFVDGGSLNGLILEQSLGQVDAVRLALGILAAVGHLHTARFLHRDVKPGNLLLGSSSMGRLLKLGDFGSVRRLELAETRVTASQHSALYRPTEAWGDDGWFTYSSDLYQVGICLYEMVNGPLPYTFEAHLDAQSRRMMKERGVKSLIELDPFERSQMADGCLERRIRTGRLLEMTPPQPYFSNRLTRIVRKATAVETADRYQDAFEFHKALMAFSAPNWKIASGGFVADSWKGWNWKVAPLPSSSPASWVVLRAKQMTENYRAFGGRHGSPRLACKSVEDFA